MPSLKKCWQGIDPHLYYPEYLGTKLGKRYCVFAGIYGNSAEEAGTGNRFPAIHSNAHWRWIPHDEGGIRRAAIMCC